MAKARIKFKNQYINANGPALIGAGTSHDGAKVILVFDRAMDNPAGKHTQFSYSIDGTPATFTAASLGTNNKTVELACNTTIQNGEEVLVNYTAGNVIAGDGGAVTSFSDLQAGNAVNGAVSALPHYEDFKLIIDASDASRFVNSSGDILKINDSSPCARVVVNNHTNRADFTTDHIDTTPIIATLHPYFVYPWVDLKRDFSIIFKCRVLSNTTDRDIAGHPTGTPVFRFQTVWNGTTSSYGLRMYLSGTPVQNNPMVDGLGLEEDIDTVIAITFNGTTFTMYQDGVALYTSTPTVADNPHPFREIFGFANSMQARYYWFGICNFKDATQISNLTNYINTL